MKATVTLTEYTCDGCGMSTRVDDNAEGPAYGFHGEVTHIGDFGGNGADWYAHTNRCIKRAILNALARDDRE